MSIPPADVDDDPFEWVDAVEWVDGEDEWVDAVEWVDGEGNVAEDVKDAMRGTEAARSLPTVPQQRRSSRKRKKPLRFIDEYARYY